jgi:hypothetical protein
MGECSVDNNGAEKWIEYYSSSHKILVGEGDFSFASFLAKVFGTAANMIAMHLFSFQRYKSGVVTSSISPSDWDPQQLLTQTASNLDLDR